MSNFNPTTNNEKLELLIAILKKKVRFNPDTDEYSETYHEIVTDNYRVMVVEPHEGTDFKWVLKVTSEADFDRWANSSTVRLEYDNVDTMLTAVKMNWETIAFECMRNLTKEYRSLWKAYRDLWKAYREEKGN